MMRFFTRHRDTTWKQKMDVNNKKTNPKTKMPIARSFLFLLWGPFFVLREPFLLYAASKMPRRFVFEYWTPFVDDVSAVIKDDILRFD